MLRKKKCFYCKSLAFLPSRENEFPRRRRSSRDSY